MKHFIRNILFLLLGITIGIAGTVNHYKKSQEQAVSDTLPRISAPKLYAAYSESELRSNRKYWNTAIQVEGIIQEVYKTRDGNVKVYLHSNHKYRGVTCKLKNASKQIKKPLKIGNSIVMQGYCFGMDKNVRLTECRIVNRGI